MASSCQIGLKWNLAVLFFKLTHRLTESDFWCDVILSSRQPWRHYTQKSAAIWWVLTKRLPRAYASASANSWSIVHSFVFYLKKYYCKNVFSSMSVGMLIESACACTWLLYDYQVGCIWAHSVVRVNRCIAVHIDLGYNYFAALYSELCVNLVLCVEHFVCGCSILLPYVMLSWPAAVFVVSCSCVWAGRPPASLSRLQLKDSFVGLICSRVYLPSTRFTCFYVASAWSFSSFSLVC